MLSHPSDTRAPVPESGQQPERLADRRNLLQLVELRWLAVAGQLLTIVIVQVLLDARRQRRFSGSASLADPNR